MYEKPALSGVLHLLSLLSHLALMVAASWRCMKQRALCTAALSLLLGITLL